VRNIIKSAIYTSFISITRLLAGSGMSRIPMIRATYDFLFKALWPGKRIIEVEGSRMYVDLHDELLLRKTFAWHAPKRESSGDVTLESEKWG
jgi:hypothetical protein